MPLLYAAFYAVLCTVIAVRMPVMNWTNEVTPIKQSGGVLIAIFGGWAICAVIAVGYLTVGWRLGGGLYLLIWCVLLAVITLLLQRWLDTKGAEAFAAL
jgi:ABC-2 type transport system permease protein